MMQNWAADCKRTLTLAGWCSARDLASRCIASFGPSC